MQWIAANRCVPLPDTVPMDTVAGALAARHLRPTGTVVVDRTGETTRLCYRGYTLEANWLDLAWLRDQYGWTFVSNGQTHDNITLMPAADQKNESCGSLPAFTAHGHQRAWGLFAYGNNKYTDQIQATIVSTCFSYGRTYQKGALNQRGSMGAPWFQKTTSVNGGQCNDSALPCYTMTVGGNTRYFSRDLLTRLVTVPQDAWMDLQAYKFVTGSRTAGIGYTWDCSKADWRAHWTSDSELYCWSDYLSAIDRIPVGVVVTDPASVAQAWGRGNPGP